MDDEYKTNYFGFHLTLEDYTRISKNIISFHNGKFKDIENIEYWPIYNSTNQMNFTHNIIFDSTTNFPSFVEKMIGIILNKIFKRVKQFIENV